MRYGDDIMKDEFLECSHAKQVRVDSRTIMECDLENPEKNCPHNFKRCILGDPDKETLAVWNICMKGHTRIGSTTNYCCDCNTCSASLPYAIAAYKVARRLVEKYGNEEDYFFVRRACETLTVCPLCHCDEFVHVEGCPLEK